MIHNSRTLTVSIDCRPGKVYGFVSNPENLPRWATAFCKSIRKSEGRWIMETPLGPVGVRFVEKNEWGVLDHYVSPARGVEIQVPMRVVANGTGSEVVFTLFQTPEMTDDKLAEDIRMVEQDLRTLKRILEG
jgi:hypothetical protein